MSRLPSKTYLRQCAADYEHTVNTDLKLVVLDLNGTLVWRPDRAKSTHQPILRRGMQEFTQYLFANFAVMVWSSSSPKSVAHMVGEFGLMWTSEH